MVVSSLEESQDMVRIYNVPNKMTRPPIGIERAYGVHLIGIWQASNRTGEAHITICCTE